ncbi:hypothetical protein RCL1_005675 [Eukaryota sp. TZLM3-RCL]
MKTKRLRKIVFTTANDGIAMKVNEVDYMGPDFSSFDFIEKNDELLENQSDDSSSEEEEELELNENEVIALLSQDFGDPFFVEPPFNLEMID